MIGRIEQLLEQAGHRPPPHVKGKWTCANCPPGKSRSLSVNAEVFHCFRCGLGGNIVTLRKELGLYSQKTSYTREERRRYGREMSLARVHQASFKNWLKSMRDNHRRWHREEYGLHLWVREETRRHIDEGKPIPAALDKLYTQIVRLRLRG